jgi:hypothetical protein
MKMLSLVAAIWSADGIEASRNLRFNRFPCGGALGSNSFAVLSTNILPNWVEGSVVAFRKRIGIEPLIGAIHQDLA